MAEYVTETVTIDISADDDASTAVNIKNRKLRAIHMPAAWTAADIGFSISPDGTTYYTLTAQDGTAIILDGLAASDYLDLSEEVVLPNYGWLKLTSLDPSDATAEAQGADRSIKLVFEVDEVDTTAVALTIDDDGTDTNEVVAITGYQLRGIFGDGTAWDDGSGGTIAIGVSLDGGTTWTTLHEIETDYDAAAVAATLAVGVYVDLSEIEIPAYGQIKLTVDTAQSTGEAGRDLILVLEPES